MTVSILSGDALTVLRAMESESIDCCVTSPPYWGLRDYGVEGQLGMEPTLAEHIAVMVEIFEEVRRVLKPTGTFWLNYGDCYATQANGRSAADYKADGKDDRTFRDKPFSTVGAIYGATPQVTKSNGAANGTKRRGGGNAPCSGYLKPKDLCMIPNRLAIALQDAGWWVRSELIWGKPNPMPDSSGSARPSTAHEKIWLLTKSGDADVWRARDTGEISFNPDLTERCPLITDPDKEGVRWLRMGAYYDAKAVEMEGSMASLPQYKSEYTGKATKNYAAAKAQNPSAIKSRIVNKQSGHSRRHDGFNARWDAMEKSEQCSGKRLLRNFENDLSELAPAEIIAWEIAIQGFSGAHFATFPPSLVVPCILAGCPKGGTVLDPFGGAGTTGLVADRLGRNAVMIELNPEYHDIAADRLRAAMVKVETERSVRKQDAGPLFGAAA